VAITGPGRFSLDYLAGWTVPPIAGAVLAVGVGLLGWLAGDAARDASLAGLFDRPSRHMRHST
jgi:hypothetical protein